MENPRFTIALIYDFDGTLAPGNMQEYDFIPAVGKSNKEFWTEANTLAEEQDADMVLTYMARMIQEAKSKGLSLRREAFRESGRKVWCADIQKEQLLYGWRCKAVDLSISKQFQFNPLTMSPL